MEDVFNSLILLKYTLIRIVEILWNKDVLFELLSISAKIQH